jgi:hypothetical protein
MRLTITYGAKSMGRKFRSNLEGMAFCILEHMYPNVVIEHDYQIGGGLQIDFLVRSAIPIAIEVDGPQHKEFNAHFHKSIADFEAQKDRDKRKTRICRTMGIPLIRLDGKKDLDTDVIHAKVMQALADYEKGDWKPKPVSKKDEYRNSCKERERKRRKEYYRWAKDNRRTGGQ